MSLTFPLPLRDFWLKLPISRLSFDLPGVATHARTQGGEVLPADIGARLWTAEVEMEFVTAEEWAEIEGLLALLQGAATSFLICDTRRPAPAADPDGRSLSGASPLTGRGATRREIAITGLPGRYRISSSDMLSLTYGRNPLRYSLHKVVIGGEASAGGALSVPVVPELPAGLGEGASVRLIRPVCKALIVPGSYEAGRGRSGGAQEGVSFTCIQTRR